MLTTIDEQAGTRLSWKHRTIFDKLLDDECRFDRTYTLMYLSSRWEVLQYALCHLFSQKKKKKATEQPAPSESGFAGSATTKFRDRGRDGFPSVCETVTSVETKLDLNEVAQAVRHLEGYQCGGKDPDG
ncbi:hypothetical protein PHSY_005189 [Pseudozyma hubeiensis SY62]|uniref:Uncharacterized protein n=1 Tax=Pseudozyma hubeiensis (strain SY62) TaxID=1305764 RepID=R9P879_PSEHS|nr:hypothetical protein PHSY_005189 [Pseudozyma hubeiensis SY62]GAC97603.1 hypothetical protein PHSY_005189 [Pseudozyma hubeiensis SY62]